MDIKGSRYYIFLASAVALSVIVFVAMERLWGHWRFVNEPFHAAVEAAGAVASAVIAILIFYGKEDERENVLLYPGLGFLGMGVLDCFHAVSSPGRGFVLLHSTATLAGAAFFAAVWLDPSGKGIRRWRRAPHLVALSLVVFGLWVIFARDTLPAMTSHGKFTPAAIMINLSAGMLFLASSLRLLVDFNRQRKTETYIFAFMAALFGTAGLMFPFSVLWDNTWWMWHFLRLAAFSIALGYTFFVFRRSSDNVRRLNVELTAKTTQLEASNKELEAFSYSVSHDLRAPLRGIDGFSQILLEDYAEGLDAQGKDYLRRVRAASQRLGVLIDDMLKLARITRSEMKVESVDLGAIAESIAEELKAAEPHRSVSFRVSGGLAARGDPHLLRIALENLISNAWKFTSKNPQAEIEFGSTVTEGARAYYVRDNGVGFNMEYADRLFGAFQRLHASSEFPGTGVGLATSQRIVHRHGGRVWADSAPDKGATFYFTIEGGMS